MKRFPAKKIRDLVERISRPSEFDFFRVVLSPFPPRSTVPLHTIVILGDDGISPI